VPRALVLLAAAILACGDPPAPPAAAKPAPAVLACAAAAGDRSPADLAIVRAACSERGSLGTPGIAIAIAEAGANTFRFAHGVRCSGAAGDGWTAYDVREDYDRFAFGVDAAAPAGAVAANADDLLRFALALSGADGPAWASGMREAVTGAAKPGGAMPGGRYAAGLDVVDGGGELVLRHTGSTGDFWAELVFVPERGVAVAVLGNTGKPLAATMAAALTRIGVDPRRD